MAAPLTPHTPAPRQSRLALPRVAPGSRAERLSHIIIVGAAILCFTLLTWDHLGLGAALFPPAATHAHQTALAGPYTITYQQDSSLLIASASATNTLTFTVCDASGRPITDATLTLQPTMTTMPMQPPAETLHSASDGRYVARLRFSMAGDWRLDLAISLPTTSRPTSTSPLRVSFTVSVRWR